jgi:hypothetical protein
MEKIIAIIDDGSDVIRIPSKAGDIKLTPLGSAANASAE